MSQPTRSAWIDAVEVLHADELGCALHFEYLTVGGDSGGRQIRRRRQVRRPLAHGWCCSGESNSSLVENLCRAGIVERGSAVHAAMLATDRGIYVLPPGPSARISPTYNYGPYADAPQSIGHKATISAPHIQAKALAVLGRHCSRPGARVLDVGCGSGVIVAYMVRMGSAAVVVGIDIVPELVDLSRRNLRRDGLVVDGRSLVVEVGNGWRGAADYGPFDAIHVGAGASSVPPFLVAQLKPQGRMVIPVGAPGTQQQLLQVDRRADGSTTEKLISTVRFVPLVQTHATGTGGDGGRGGSRRSGAARVDYDFRYKKGWAYGRHPSKFLSEVATTPGWLPFPASEDSGGGGGGGGAHILSLGEGQGRNVTYLASLGHQCVAVDASPVGLRKAQRLATERGVADLVSTIVADLATFDPAHPRGRSDGTDGTEGICSSGEGVNGASSDGPKESMVAPRSDSRGVPDGQRCASTTCAPRPPRQSSWDAIVSVYCMPFAAPMRRRLHRACATTLRPGGIIVIECFAPRQQLAVRRGLRGADSLSSQVVTQPPRLSAPSWRRAGPTDPSLLVDFATLTNDFSGLGLEVLVAREVERDELAEGKYHRGPAVLTQFVARRMATIPTSPIQCIGGPAHGPATSPESRARASDDCGADTRTTRRAYRAAAAAAASEITPHAILPASQLNQKVLYRGHSGAPPGGHRRFRADMDRIFCHAALRVAEVLAASPATAPGGQPDGALARQAVAAYRRQHATERAAMRSSGHCHGETQHGAPRPGWAAPRARGGSSPRRRGKEKKDKGDLLLFCAGASVSIACASAVRDNRCHYCWIPRRSCICPALLASVPQSVDPAAMCPAGMVGAADDKGRVPDDEPASSTGVVVGGGGARATIKWIILMHPNEFLRAASSAKLGPALLGDNCELVVYGEPGHNERLGALLAQAGDTLRVLYPGGPDADCCSVPEMLRALDNSEAPFTAGTEASAWVADTPDQEVQGRRMDVQEHRSSRAALTRSSSCQAVSKLLTVLVPDGSWKWTEALLRNIESRFLATSGLATASVGTAAARHLPVAHQATPAPSTCMVPGKQLRYVHLDERRVSQYESPLIDAIKPGQGRGRISTLEACALFLSEVYDDGERHNMARGARRAKPHCGGMEHDTRDDVHDGPGAASFSQGKNSPRHSLAAVPPRRAASLAHDAAIDDTDTAPVSSRTSILGPRDGAAYAYATGAGNGVGHGGGGGNGNGHACAWPGAVPGVLRDMKRALAPLVAYIETLGRRAPLLDGEEDDDDPGMGADDRRAGLAGVGPAFTTAGDSVAQHSQVLQQEPQKPQKPQKAKDLTPGLRVASRPGPEQQCHHQQQQKQQKQQQQPWYGAAALPEDAHGEHAGRAWLAAWTSALEAAAKRMVAAAGAEGGEERLSPPGLRRCNLCGVEMSTPLRMEQHLTGRRHCEQVARRHLRHLKRGDNGAAEAEEEEEVLREVLRKHSTAVLFRYSQAEPPDVALDAVARAAKLDSL